MKKRFLMKGLMLSLCVFFIGGCSAKLAAPVIKNSEIEEIMMDSFVIGNDRVEENVVKLPSQNVTLYDAAHSVVFYHPRIKRAQENELSEKELINIAQAGYYPQIRGGTGLKYDRNNSGRYNKDYLQNLNIEVNQMLYDFGKTASAISSAEYGYLSSKENTAITNEELIYTATQAVVAIDRYQKLSILAKGQVTRVDDLVGLVEARNDKGASNLSDVLQAKSRLDEVLSEELDTDFQKLGLLRSLGILIGRTNITEVSVDDVPVELIGSCNILAEWEQIPEFAIADLEAKRASVDLDRAKAEELPSIYLQGSTSRSINDSPRYGSKTDTTISLNMTVPLYQGGSLSAGKRAAESRANAAFSRKEEVRIEINQMLSDAKVNLDNLLKRQGLLRQRVENLRGTKELYKKQYLDLGTRSLIDLLNSEQEFYRAQVEVQNNQSAIIQTGLDCAFYQGKLRSYFKVGI